VRKKLMLFRQWVVCFAALAGYFFILIEFIRDPFFDAIKHLSQPARGALASLL